MLSIEEIKKQYQENLHQFDRGLLREYLQYQLLDLIFKHPLGRKLSFLGGTCLRIVYNNKRFSEDLDFDNQGLTEKEFLNLVEYLEKELDKLGLSTETKITHKKAFRCYLKFPKLLYEYGLSPHMGEKITIQLDTFDQKVAYQTEFYILNQFDIFKRIIITPKEVILSQKLWTITQRKRLQGRDFYDALFLLQNTKPNKKFLQAKFAAREEEKIKKIILEKTKNINWDELIKNLQPFVFKKEAAERIKLFPELIKQVEF